MSQGRGIWFSNHILVHGRVDPTLRAWASYNCTVSGESIGSTVKLLSKRQTSARQKFDLINSDLCTTKCVCDFIYSDRPSHIQADPPTLKPLAFICPNPEKLIAMAFVLIFLAYHLFIPHRNYVIITSLFRSGHALFGTWKHEASPPFLFYTWQGPEIELRDVLALGNAPYNILRPSLAFEWSFWIFFFV